jgi:hypothetical protein
MNLRKIVKVSTISVITCDMMSKPLQNEPHVAAVSKAWPWPSSLDALVAAPQHHRLMYENERVRVLEVRIPRFSTHPPVAGRSSTCRAGASMYGAIESARLSLIRVKPDLHQRCRPWPGALWSAKIT